MADILTHDPADTLLLRGVSIETEISAYVFGGGAGQQFVINLDTPLVGGASYTFAGEVTALSDSGIIHGICAGGNDSGGLVDAVGPFSQTIVASAASDGLSQFALRGSTGTTGRLIGVTLEPGA